MLKLIAFPIIVCLIAVNLANAEHVKVFLLGGQSNMQGVGNNIDLPADLQSPQTDVRVYFGSSLTVLQPGFGYTSSQFGPEITFGRTLADARPTENFALIKYAVSATNLYDQWDPSTGSVYTNFQNTVTNGLAALTNAGHTTEIVGMLWTQGERDARAIGDDGRANTYEADLNELIADVRTNYGSDLPFFLSQLSSDQTNLPASGLNAVRLAQANVAADDPLAWMVNTDGFSLNDDDLHFDATGQQSLGTAFATSYINLVPEPATMSLLALGGIAMLRRRKK